MICSRQARADALALDDWKLVMSREAERRDLLEIIDDRHGSRSPIVASQLSVEK